MLRMSCEFYLAEHCRSLSKDIRPFTLVQSRSYFPKHSLADYKGMRAVLPLLVHSRLRINLVINRDDPTSTWRGRIPRLAVARVAPDSASSPTNSLQQLGEISSESRGTLSNCNWIAMGCKSRDRPTAEFSGGAKAMTGPETLACRASAPV